MEKETLATEIIKERDDKIFSILWKLDFINDDLKKTLSICGELSEKIDLKEPETKKDALDLHENIKDIDNMMVIIIDYIQKICDQVGSIVAEERDTLIRIINARMRDWNKQ